MAEQPARSPFRLLWRLTLIGALILIMIGGLGLGYLFSLPRPDAQELAAADHKYEQVRALYPKASTPTPVATPSQTQAQTPSTTESLQARCDQMFLELLVPTGMMSALDTRLLDSKLKTARQLAAMYDSGIRVSDQARSHYRLVHSDVFSYLAQGIATGMHPDNPNEIQYSLAWSAREPNAAFRAPLFENLVKALKLLRVADCPIQHLYIYQELIVALQPPSRNWSGPLPKLPPELLTLDLNLLAPRRALDWPRYMALVLEHNRDRRKSMEQMMDTGYVYHQLREMESRDRASEPWHSKLYGHFRSVGGSLIYSHKYAPQLLNEFQYIETSFEDFATSSAKAAVPIPNDNVMNQLDFDQLQARLIAGALALRRGEPVPAPDKIGPDSYFFDPVMQRPYILYSFVTGSQTDVLSVRRPFRFENNGRVQEITRIDIALPANLPGLDKIPRMP